MERKEREQVNRDKHINQAEKDNAKKLVERNPTSYHLVPLENQIKQNAMVNHQRGLRMQILEKQ